MDTEKRIEKIKEYFQEMKVFTDDNNVQNVYVSVKFPPNWVNSELITPNYGVQVIKDESNVTYFWGELSQGIERLFDAIDFNIQENIDAQKRLELFRAKMEELKSIFENQAYSVEDLQGLTIMVNGSKTNTPPFLKKGKGKKQQEAPVKPEVKETPTPIPQDEGVAPSDVYYETDEMPTDIPTWDGGVVEPIDTEKKKK